MQNPAAVAPPSSVVHRQLTIFISSESIKEAKQLHSLSLKTGTFNLSPVSSRLVSLYTSQPINDLIYARSVFDTIQSPSLPLWNMMIKCYVENHRSHDAIRLFCDMLTEFPPDNFTLPCVVKGCSRLCAVEEGKQIHGFSTKLGFGFDKFVQSSLVSFYSKCGLLDCARKVFDKMGEKDLVTWNSLIDGYARSGDVETARKLFDEIPRRDSYSWTALLHGFSKSGKIEAARDVFDKMPTKNLVSWNAMINGYMRSGDFESACELFNTMPERNLITWNSIIAGYEVYGRFEEALSMFLRMLQEEEDDFIKPNNATFTSLISAVAASAILSTGKWVHSYMVKNGMAIDGVIGTLLIEMYSKCGSIESALTVFTSIHRKKLGHWNSVIVGLGMHGMADEALELFKKMQESGIKPNTVTFVGLLNAFSHVGYVKEAHLYFDFMVKKYGIEREIEHYGCLVDVLCRTGRLQEAKTVIEEMKIRPNKVILMSLLRGARMFVDTEIGEYAAHRLKELAPECYVALSNMYAAAGKWEKVSEVRETMKKKGIKKEAGWSLIERKGVIHRFIVGDRSHPQSEEIYAKLKEMREKLKAAGHVADTRQVLLRIEDEKEKEAELELHSERLAIAYGLINNNNDKSPIRVVKNLTVCNDCHSVTKFLSRIYQRDIIVRDNSRFHHFRDGLCSCNDFW
ncbi:pentatricopeptide repeat-containing protein At2g29760, chloroplastic [Eutrema salsugineum]|uniref:pentatricopeptide repeat-containing protein At2g29760, chloroplastic n=1 Tax=Eutrema salsugineum TaxID=72664 RepID=UPI000CED0268|nr:pentatricopeptide repeat-containing protein At2g29760, chloroplastic [Eutrema salsugineum]